MILLIILVHPTQQSQIKLIQSLIRLKQIIPKFKIQLISLIIQQTQMTQQSIIKQQYKIKHRVKILKMEALRMGLLMIKQLIMMISQTLLIKLPQKSLQNPPF